MAHYANIPLSGQIVMRREHPRSPVRTTLGLILAFALAGLRASAAPVIEYAATDNVFWVRSSSEQEPATPADLLTFDRNRQLGKIAYDATNDCYRVSANLWIGDNQSAGAFFQIGRSNHPAETLAVAGNIWIRPPRNSIIRRDGRRAIVNRLTVGSAADPGIKARLSILCGNSAAEQYSLAISEYDAKAKQSVFRGDLLVFNGTLDVRNALTGQPMRTGINTRWYASDIRFVNSTIAGFIVTMFRAADQNQTVRLDGTTFENGNIQLMDLCASNCVFRNLDQVVRDKAVLTRCTLTGNKNNFWFDGSIGGEVILIDSTLGPSTQPLAIQKNKTDPRRAASSAVFPSVIERQTLAIKVVDANDKPVPQAWVCVKGREEFDAVVNGIVLTDVNGLTPSAAEAAIQLTVHRWRATSDAARPAESTFTFEVRVRKPGFEELAVDLCPAESPCPHPLILKLKKR